jgi:hypothetical protein
VLNEYIEKAKADPSLNTNLLFLNVTKERNLSFYDAAPKTSAPDKPNKFRIVLIWSIIVFCLSSVFVLFSFYNNRPIYNFCWGDYEKTYKKKESYRAALLNIYFVEFLLAIIVNIGTAYITS